MNTWSRNIGHIFIVFLLIFFSPTVLPESEVSLEELGKAELQYNINRYVSDSELLLMENSFRRTHAKHQNELMEIAEAAYKTQQWMTVAIFFIVSILVLGGMYLSYLQFRLDTKQGNSENIEPKASFKISKDGIEFGSSVIGLVVLFMSFMFFHLYVKDVYSIKTNAIEPISFVAAKEPNTDNANK